jgi:methionyl-tRNA formyltransferase
MSGQHSLRIIYSGTPEFAVEPLKTLIDNGYNIIAVITAPDKPAGRGMNLQQSPVKQFALEHGLKVLQPLNLKDADFLTNLSELNPDLHIVVAFRMMPEALWRMPRLGTFNLHASLLPQYRGAAPINRAIMNGEKITGVTTFFLQKEIDSGDIILSQPVPIEEDDDAGSLHDKLMTVGAQLVLQTVQLIEHGNVKTHRQPIDDGQLSKANKIFKPDCRINWHQPCQSIRNHIRGLSPYPGAYTELQQNGKQSLVLKILKASIQETTLSVPPGTIYSDGKNELRIAAENGWLILETVQLEGKKKMNVKDFLRGFPIHPYTVKN